MASVDSRELMKALLGLQKIDHEVWRLRQRILETPRLLDRRAERMRAADAKVAAGQAAQQELKKQIGLFELDVKTKEAEIQKIQGAQGQSRTNEEFRAFGDQIGRIRKEIRAIEDRILDCMTRIDAAERELVDLRSQSASHKKEVDADLAQWKIDEAEYQRELEQRLAERAEYVRCVPAGPLSTYDRVLKKREGKALVSGEGKVCGGCQMGLTPNDFSRLQRLVDVVTCRNCERILYLPEAMAALQ